MRRSTTVPSGDPSALPDHHRRAGGDGADPARLPRAAAATGAAEGGRAYSGFLRSGWCQAKLDLALLFDDRSDPALARRPLLEDRLSLHHRRARRDTAPRRMALSALARWPLILPGRERRLRRIIDEAMVAAGHRGWTSSPRWNR